ncbi:MAG: PDZ domain-containing protein [Planctomycetes bacterium]|nr:PDZ domain-containing protein [Planctomycetota bacterium]
MRKLLFIAFIYALAPLAYSQGAFLGVQLEAPQSATANARIAGVEQPSAASLMGLQKGDVILAVDDTPTETVEALLAALSQRLPGDIVEITIFRKLEELKLTGILGRKPEDRQIYSRPQPRWDLGPEFEVPEWPQFPTMPEFPAMPKFPAMPGWPKWGESLQLPDINFEFLRDGETSTEVEIRYPENTPQLERQTLIDQAIAEYGEDVKVEFEGDIHSISIRQISSSNKQVDIPSPFPKPGTEEEL